MIWVLDNGGEYDDYAILFVETRSDDEAALLEAMLARKTACETVVAKAPQMEFVVPVSSSMAEFIRGRRLPPDWERDRAGNPRRSGVQLKL